MMKQSILLLFLLLSIFSAICLISPRHSNNSLTATEKMLIHILQECNLGLNVTIFYTGNHPDLTQALLRSQSSMSLGSWSLMSFAMDRSSSDLISTNGIILVLNSRIEYSDIYNVMNNWNCIDNCKVIILSKLFNSCKLVVDILKFQGFFYYDNSYYICNDKKNAPIVFTQDRYNNIRQRHWNRVTVKVDSMYDGRIYFRPYNEDICRNFDFERVRPVKNANILLGVVRRVRNKDDMEKDFILDVDIHKFPPILVDSSIQIVEKISEVKFSAYIKTFLLQKGATKYNFIPFFWASTYVDVMGITAGLLLDVKVAYSHPVFYDTFVILSHKQAEATPLQKIAKFYGILTLMSLITLLVIVFFVIYLKSNGNATLAAFDVLRLVINSGVEIPINTLSLKIFFCMIFLYFIVIHSTFSGNLPRFLTIPEYHDSIDSLEDLSNPWITTIYDKGFYTEHYEFKDKEIKRKVKYLFDHSDLFEHFMMDKNSVCIINKIHANLLTFNLGKSMNEIHISKNDIGDAIFGIVSRPRFYLREKFQRATSYMFDVSLNKQLKSVVNKAQRTIIKQRSTSDIKFRKITVNDLMFAFIFLTIGNTVGLVCFLIELVMGKKYHQRINFELLKGCLKFKGKKTRINIRRIVVKPKPDIADMN
ncbi:uncharacterized protein [Chelonus insularis]|uniref:uncharacterized protein n=1 Tax=Chelonus insularis TaxID=460826 RepID=UPI00158ACBE4|nr:uncharacterized protein LOC118063603 [Chelonus insularis]